MLQAVPPDSLRRALDEVFAGAEYAWTAQRSPFDWLWDVWYRLLDWLDTLQTAHPAGFNLMLAALLAALAILLVHIGYVVWRISRPTARTAAGASAVGAAAAREDAEAQRARAQELARAGRYAEALAVEFVALLLDLERRRALRFHASKTPGEYVREARLDPSGRASLAELVARLYRHLFGGVPCDDHGYRDFAAAAQLVPTHVSPA